MHAQKVQWNVISLQWLGTTHHNAANAGKINKLFYGIQRASQVSETNLRHDDVKQNLGLMSRRGKRSRSEAEVYILYWIQYRSKLIASRPEQWWEEPLQDGHQCFKTKIHVSHVVSPVLQCLYIKNAEISTDSKLSDAIENTGTMSPLDSPCKLIGSTLKESAKIWAHIYHIIENNTKINKNGCALSSASCCKFDFKLVLQRLLLTHIL